MLDRREAILARLLVVCQEVADFVTVARNVTDLSGRGVRPALVVQDGDEDFDDPPGRSNHSGRASLVVTMTPAIMIAAQGSADTIGATLNALRAAVLYAVLNDSTLEGLCGTNGRMAYAGCAVRLDEGEKVEGQMLVRLSFTYLFRLAELAPEATADFIIDENGDFVIDENGDSLIDG